MSESAWTTIGIIFICIGLTIWIRGCNELRREALTLCYELRPDATPTECWEATP